MVIIRFVDSQWLDGVTLESLLVNVTFHDTAMLVLTVNAVLFGSQRPVRRGCGVGQRLLVLLPAHRGA